VLSIGKLVATQASYYTQQLTHSLGEDTPVLAPNGSGQTDYYTAHRAPSRWLGSGLSRLGLESGAMVDSEVFEHLMNHRSPQGVEMILPHAVRLKVAAFDLTLSAPKSVSLLYAFGKEEVRSKVLEAHREAVNEAIAYMEAQASQTRLVERHRGADGASRMETRTVGTRRQETARKPRNNVPQAVGSFETGDPSILQRNGLRSCSVSQPRKTAMTTAACEVETSRRAISEWRRRRR